MGCGAATAYPMTEAARPVSQVASMPPPASVLPIERVQILCLLSADGRFDRLQLQSDLCQAAAVATRQSSDSPVEVIGIGDPKLLDPTALTLLVHASLGQIKDQPVITLAIRTFQARAEQGDIFGPPPMTMPFQHGIDETIGSALAAALQPLVPRRLGDAT